MENGAAVSGELLDALLEAVFVGLEHYARQGDAGKLAVHRLAFRELGVGMITSACWGSEVIILHRALPILKGCLRNSFQIDNLRDQAIRICFPFDVITSLYQ